MLQWTLGELPPELRVWSALFPALLFTAVFVLGLPIFAIRCVLYGIPRDEETQKRGASVLVGFFLRYYFFWLSRPVFNLILRSGIPADALTALSVLLGAASAVAVAAGRFALGGWLFLFAGILDALDGRVARARNEGTPAGAAMDSILDRYTDSFILIGLAWYYRDSFVLLLVLFALLGSSLVPYVRARGEGLGVELRVGLMQRLERVLCLGAAVALSPILEVILFPDDHHPRHYLAVAGVTFLAISSNLTAITRFLALLRALGGHVAKMPRFVWSRLYSISATATAIDFLVVMSLVESAGLTPTSATALGAALGSTFDWSIRRGLSIIRKEGSPAEPRLGRFVLASGTKTALSAGGMALLSLFPQLDYRLAWALVRIAVGLAWSLPLRRYLFRVERVRSWRSATGDLP